MSSYLNDVGIDLPRSCRFRWSAVQLLSVSVVSLVLSGGCGSAADPAGLQKVTGVVTLDGAPIVDGAIRFEPAKGESIQTAEGAPIVNGQYEILAKQGLAPGKYRVFISGTQSAVDTRSIDEQMKHPSPPPKAAVPAKYNEKSTLTAEVTPGGANQHDFPLSKK